jgi:outer membrane lipoprotein-sorting protein
MDLFKLGEGPFPLPIGQSPADVHKQFDITKVAPAKDDPANTVHLGLVPKAGTELEKKFKSLDFWVDQKTHMPVRVDTADKQQTIRSTELSDLTLNPPGGLPESDFTLPPIGSDWNRHVESLND